MYDTQLCPLFSNSKVWPLNVGYLVVARFQAAFYLFFITPSVAHLHGPSIEVAQCGPFFHSCPVLDAQCGPFP